MGQPGQFQLRLQNPPEQAGPPPRAGHLGEVAGPSDPKRREHIQLDVLDNGQGV